MSITQARVAIITVTFNSDTFIDNFLHAISPFISDSPHELILIDNASTDDTTEHIQQYIDQQKLHKNTHTIKLPKNVGFGQGCNAGIARAFEIDATHMWFLNPDTEALNNSAEELLALFTADSSADFVGSVLINEDKQARAGAFRFPSALNVCLSSLKLGVLDKAFNNHTTAIPIEKKAYQADWLTGASFMVRSNCIETLGGFDPTFFLYFEEVDLFYRAKQKGFSVWCCPDSKVFHISGASTGINNQKKDADTNTMAKRQPSYWFESRRHFYISNYGKAYFTLVDICQISCLCFWKIRAALQNKKDDTPSHFMRDIVRHSYPYGLLKHGLSSNKK
jgi:N-acetylglucosaminyl-diphospho-decaprenol L-rhamnosyltransferase